MRKRQANQRRKARRLQGPIFLPQWSGLGDDGGVLSTGQTVVLAAELRVARFHTLDAMRGFAAVAVVVYHLGRPNPHGSLAVDLFFILSGFVLSHAYGSRIGFGRLMAARVARLYPIFAVGALVGLAIRGGDPLMLLMIPNPDSSLLYPANTALWSVAFEMVASIGFALLYRFGFRVWLAIWISSGMACLLFIGEGGLGTSWATVAPGLIRMAFSFTTGIGLYHLFRRINLRWQSRYAWCIALLPFALTFSPIQLAPMQIAAIYVIFPIIVLAGALVEIPDEQAASWLGSISYPIYAIHLPIVAAAGWLSVPFVVAGAYLLDRHYDRPVRQWLKGVLSRSGSAQPGANAAMSMGNQAPDA